MGSSLAPRNVIITELEKKIVKPMIESRRLKFYVRYVHDTLLLAKEGDINYIFGKFNSIRKYLKFAIYRFDDNNNVHFLDIAINKFDTDLYYEPTHTGQYSRLTSSLLWNYKISWIKSLYNRAKKICSSKKNLNVELIKFSYLCHGTVIHLTVVILLSSDLETMLIQTEMKR